MRRSTPTLFLLLACVAPLAACDDGDDGPPGPPPGAQPAPGATLEARARAATFLGSCVPDDGAQRWLNSANYEFDVDRTSALIAVSLPCFATARSGCDAIAACTGLTVTTDGPCERSCAGNVAEVCDDLLRFRQDCAVTGEICVEGRCVAAGEPCEADDDFASVCVDGRPTACDRGRTRSGPACAPLGLECAQDDEFGPSAYCSGTGEACEPESYGPFGVEMSAFSSCTDNVGELCIGQGIHQVDCQFLHPTFTCQTVGGAAFCGAAAQCDPRSAGARCEGDDLVLCSGGREVRVSCPALGFDGCSGRACSPGLLF